ncbi:MAG TPA: DJ-1/PfpI family protein [Ktedonosporobacter sp.]|nr:DJ-1/PfpI family protein [Ktedonosporobacter sp.]
MLYHGLTALDAIGPYEVLNQLPNSQVTFVSSRQGPVRTDSRALALGADATFADLPHPDILLVPGGIIGTLAATRNPALISWVQQAHRTSQWTLSVCSGSLILGAAGLLKGLTITTHWAARDFLSHYGATYVAERYVRHGKLITAAGVSAGVDMALFVAGEMVGEAQAQAIQLAIEYDPQPPYRAGSVLQASPETITLARRSLRKAASKELGLLVKEKIVQPFRPSELWPLETDGDE